MRLADMIQDPMGDPGLLEQQLEARQNILGQLKGHYTFAGTTETS